MIATPELSRLREVAERLAPHVLRTPTAAWPGTFSPFASSRPHASSSGTSSRSPSSGDVPASAAPSALFVKLELLQRGGSFKPRGALNTLLEARARDADALDAGVVAFSAGNHAIASAWAGAWLGVPVTVVMPRGANPFRVERCRELGAKIVFGENVAELVGIVERIRAEEGRVLVHPFEGVHTVEGTACVGLELADDVPALDAVIVPIGGGGLIAGMASAFAHVQPDCRVIGVEPAGARGMSDSLAAGAPLARVDVDTIADSLGAPLHLPLTYTLVERHVAKVVTVDDAALRAGMRRMADEMKLMVEPACAAALAALSGPLAEELAGCRVALLACGSNIDRDGWWRLAGG